jgi:hypothetical protein
MRDYSPIPYSGTYMRLGVHVGASNREVIRAARTKLANPRNPAERKDRHTFFRYMLKHHERARDLYIQCRF